MNIMLFSRILAKTGVGNHINMLADALQRQGHNVIVVSGTQEIMMSNNQVEFIKVDTLSRTPWQIVKTIIHLHQIIRKYNIEIVHCHHRVAAIYMAIYTLFFKIPYVYTLHSSNIPHDFFHRILTFHGECAIGVSTEVSNFLVEKLGVPSDEVVTVLNGVDDRKLEIPSLEQIKLIKREWDIPEDSLVVALHSRIDKVKNHLLVVEAINRLTEEERQKVTVVCSGTQTGDYYNEVLTKIREYHLESNFRFVGWVDAWKILGVSDFLFMPSLYEGFGLSVAEAFLMRIPVVRTKTAGFRDVKYCIPISEHDPMDMVELIRDALNNGVSQYSTRVQAAYDFAKEQLTAGKMAENTLNVYRRVLNRDE